MSTENRLETVPPLHEALTAIVEKNPMAGRHSYFQLKYFIVGKEPTIQSKLWQCLREMQARKESLDAIELERADMHDRIELTEIELERLTLVTPQYGVHGPADDFTKREKTVKERQSRRKLASMKKSLTELDTRQRETEEEAAFFVRAFTELQMIEPLKPYDDFEAQTEYWSARFSNEMNMKLMMEKRIDSELAKAVLSLPDGATAKRELVCILNQHQAALETQQKMLAVQEKLLAVQGENG